MTYEEYLDLYMKAIEIAKNCFKDLKYRDGSDYIGHTIRTADRLSNMPEMIIALLYDTIGRGESVISLQEKGFPEEMVKLIWDMIKKWDEDWFTYIKRIAENPITLRIKKAELEDDMDLRTFPDILKESWLLNRYKESWNYLNNKQKQSK